MMPVEELTLRTASLGNMLDWLAQPQGPHLVDGSLTENPLTALAILITPEDLYDPDSPMVGLDLMYKAGPLLWQGVDDFPPCLGAVVILPWLEVDGCPPWFEVDPCLLPLGADWVLSNCFPEAPVDGVSDWAGLGGRGLPQGWASGILGIGCLWRWGTRWIRPCWLLSSGNSPLGRSIHWSWPVTSLNSFAT